MKRLMILFIVLTGYVLAQPTYITIVGDTTDLKNTTGHNIVLLNCFGGTTPDNTGGGLFQAVDSAYVENGIHAFDHPESGQQWVRLPYIGGELSAFDDITIADDATITGNLDVNSSSTITSLDVDGGDITLEQDEVIDNSTDGDVLIVFDEDNDSL